MKDSHCKYVGLFAAALAFGLALEACDDSSSATAPQEEPASSTSQENILSSASQDALPASSGTPFGDLLSSGSDVLESSSSEEVPLSSAETLPASSAAAECYDGSASITLHNVENVYFQCYQGMTAYDVDKMILYTCDEYDNLVETFLPPCSL